MKTRKVWFITRPERDPKFHREALLALEKATDNFTTKWVGNREAHLNYERVLGESGVKRENLSASGSGGRTWAAMLRTFAYCHTNEEGIMKPTKAGLRIIEGTKVFENTKKQILTLQIPNAYFLESGFRPGYDEGFRIRPARFLIRLTNQEELDFYVTKEEITFFVLTAKKDDELASITEKIKQFRLASEDEKLKMKQEISADYDHRERSDNGARDYEKAHSDVAHTFMLITDYTGMVEYIRGRVLRVNPDTSQALQTELELLEARYPFNKRYMLSLQRMAENNGLDVDSFKASRLDSATPVATNRNKTWLKVQKLTERYPDLSILTHEEIKAALQTEMPPREAEKIAFDLRESHASFEGLSNLFVESYLNEEDNLVFEDKTGEILKAIGFDVEMRPKPNAVVETEIEILVKYGDQRCGIIDAKNYRKKFALSASLTSHMASEYIPNYDGYDGREVHFFGYVTASDFSGEKNLEKISQKVKLNIPTRDIKGFMVSARVLLAFLDHCLEEGLTRDERVELFLRAVNNKGFTSLGQLLKEASS